jgi:alpha-beta hydrolase superfamily lysophospholipase
MTTPRVPVMFIHGLWLHPASWQRWIGLFEDAGYEATAPGWPGVPGTVAEAREHPERQAGTGIADATEHYARIAGSAATGPVIVGHGLGGLIAQNLLGRGLAAAAVAIDPVPARGVLAFSPAQLRAAFPAWRNPANRNRPVSLTAAQFRYAFGNAVSERESAQLHDAWSIPAPGRALFEAAFANLTPHSPAQVNTRNAARGPLLLISGQKDHAVPDSVTYATSRQYRHSTAVTDLRQAASRGHSLTIDSGWHEIAGTVLNWLLIQTLRRPAGTSTAGPDRPDHPAREPGGWGLYWPEPDDHRSTPP